MAYVLDVNAMAATVVKVNIARGGLRIQGGTGKRMVLTPWSDSDHEELCVILRAFAMPAQA